MNTVHIRSLNSFEELNSAVRNSHSEVVQTERGPFCGFLMNASIGGLPFNTGSFSRGIRSRGVLSDDRIMIGMITGRTDLVSHWSGETHLADLLVTPPGSDHDGRYHGGASFATISLHPDDLILYFSGDPQLQDPEMWWRKRYRPEPLLAARIIHMVNELRAHIQANGATFTAEASEFWKRSIVETMTTAILARSLRQPNDHLPSSLRVVRKVEEYIDAARERPVHISEICEKLHVSRRTLHRAFNDAIGIGPVTYLRQRRLCAIYSILQRSNPGKTTIADVAMQHGFLNVGRFSSYYRYLFGEYPSETLANRRIGTKLQPVP